MEPHHGLNIVDYSVFGIVLLSGLLALMRGFVREVLSLGAWTGAYFVAAAEYPYAEPWTHQYIKNQTGATALAAVIIFVIALTILSLIGYLLARLIRGRALTVIDRSLGFLFGLLRGGLIVCLVYLGATYIPWLNTDKLDKAQATPQIPLDTANTTKPDDKNQDRDKPPEWLVEAKTRPALAYGADILKTFIPEKAIEQTMKEYDEQNVNAHRTINEQTQDMLGVPSRPPEKKDDGASYDTQSRSNLNQLVTQPSKP